MTDDDVWLTQYGDVICMKRMKTVRTEQLLVTHRMHVVMKSENKEKKKTHMGHQTEHRD